MLTGQFSETVYLSWLASCRLPLKTLTELLKNFDTAEEIYRMFTEHSDELTATGTNRETMAVMRKNAYPDKLRAFESINDKGRIRGISLRDPEYPELLREISDPPAILFYRGDLSILKKTCIAMVGSRNASVKGLSATERIARDLSNQGIVIVSGLADGIDSAAHRGCITGGTPTAAVMGCGLDRIYPVTNTALSQKILEAGGLLLSEYAPGEKPLGWHFPVRNRIISGLCKATLMMECKIRSGSMTTIRHALDQGRDVYAYPGETGTPWSEGAHQLLREGAGYFTTAADILDDLGCLDKSESCVQNNVLVQEKTETDPVRSKIIEALKDGMLGFDELTVRTGLSPQELFTALTVLMIRGTVTAYPGKMYELTVN